MRVSCRQENLAKGLSIVGKAVSSRSALPVLGNILLEAKDNQLRLAATNFEISLNCWIGAIVEDEGAITVPARLLTEFVTGLPAEPISMDLSVRTLTLNLRCTYYEANIKGIDAVDFPIIPSLGTATEPDIAAEMLEGTCIELAPMGLGKMIDQVAFAASTDESRPVLTGIEVNFSQDGLKMSATDSHRLSVCRANISDDDGHRAVDDDVTVIVPAKSLNELSRILVDSDKTQPIQILVAQARNQILFQISGTGERNKGAFHQVELVSQLIDARFPNFKVPTEYDTRTVIETASMLKAVRLASYFARENSNMVRIQLTPNNSGRDNGQLRLTATSNSSGDNITEINASIEGEGLEIGFNSRYLLDILNRIEQPQIILETTQPTKPGIIRPIGSGREECLYLMMPMHLR
ncbi:MAG: DNA polymerase III subunit beta [Chloroflexota bacterium]